LTGQLVADVQHGTETVQFAGEPRFFAPFHNKGKRGRLKDPPPPSKGGAATINMSNRSSVGVAFQSICLEIMRAINRKKEDPTAVLRAFDLNGDGSIDQDEMLFGCQTLGISVACAQIEMVWGMFKPSEDTNDIVLSQFLSIIQNASSVNKNPAAQHTQAVSHQRATKLERQKRIEQKSHVMQVMTKLSSALQQNLHEVVKAQAVSTKVLFNEISQGQETVSVLDFRSSLKEFGIEVSKEEIRLLWPAMCQKRYGPSELSAQEFSDFLSSDPSAPGGLSFEYVDDQVIRELFKNPPAGGLFDISPVSNLSSDRRRDATLISSTRQLSSETTAKLAKLPKLQLSAPSATERRQRPPPLPLRATPCTRSQAVQVVGSPTRTQIILAPIRTWPLERNSDNRSGPGSGTCEVRVFDSTTLLSSPSQLSSPTTTQRGATSPKHARRSRRERAKACAAKSGDEPQRESVKMKSQVVKLKVSKLDILNTSTRLHTSGAHANLPTPKKTEISFRFQGVDVKVSKKVLRRLKRAKSAAMVRDIISHALKKPSPSLPQAIHRPVS
jgi:Ca2+-binding EF-hand superfamily protein